MTAIRIVILIAGWSLTTSAVPTVGEPISAGIDSRQFNFGGFGGDFGGQRFPNQPFGSGPNQPFGNGQQPQRQQVRPPQPLPDSPGFNPNAPGGVFQLAVEKFPVQDDLSAELSGKLPGIQSGFISPNPPSQTKPKLQLEEGVPALAKRCTPNNRTLEATGGCANVFDVIIGRRCVGTRTTKSADCDAIETCCFKIEPKVVENKVVVPEVEVPFDQVPCGIRRTPQLAQRELQRVAIEENVDTIPMRILGGLEAFQTEICWQAALLVDGKYVCGAAVVNSRNVITSGHCLNDVESLSQVEIVTGIHNLKSEGKCADHFKASNVIFNDNYDPRSLTFDMAIIELARPITRSNCTCKVCLPESGIDKATLATMDCIVTGFGTTEAGKTPADVGPLNIANVTIIPELPNDTRCSNRLHLSPQIPKKFMTDSSMICAIGENPAVFADTCDLDGGSPLACRLNATKAPDEYTLIGLSSWGLPCGKNVVRDPAGRDVRIPTVYSYVRPSLNWIEKNTRVKA